jgi:transposase
MGDVITIGVDLAKSVFQVHGVDADGAVVVRRQLRRRQSIMASGHGAPHQQIP